jgi:hypothetical protein
MERPPRSATLYASISSIEYSKDGCTGLLGQQPTKTGSAVTTLLQWLQRHVGIVMSSLHSVLMN